jgi:hypothetical protein
MSWRSRALTLLAGSAAAVATTWLAACQHLTPSWPTERLHEYATGILATLTFGLLYLLPSRAQRKKRYLTGLFVLFVACAAVYLGLWSAFTHEVTDDGQRVIGGISLSPLIEDYRREEGWLIPEATLLKDWRNDPDVVYEKRSLALVRLASLGSWYVACASLFGWLGLLARSLQSKEPADPVLARLVDRLAAWPAGVPARLREELLRAARTLEQADNPSGAVVTAAGMLEGENGLLGMVAAARGEKLDGFNLGDQIEKLAAKGILPGDVVFDCHWVRKRSNLARHADKPITRDEALTTIQLTIQVAEWYLGRFEHGPHLALPASDEPRPQE